RFQTVNLGSFADVNPRQMAEEADLKRAYDLTYAPLSSANHGEWPTVRENDTVVCQEPLHGSHRLGAFATPPHTIAGAPGMPRPARWPSGRNRDFCLNRRISPCNGSRAAITEALQLVGWRSARAGRLEVIVVQAVAGLNPVVHP